MYASIASLTPPYCGGITMIIYISLTNTCNKRFGTNSGSTWTSIDILDNHLLLGTAKPKYIVKSNCKELFDLLVDFWMSQPLWNTATQKNSSPDWLVLGVEAQTLRTAVLVLTSNVYKNWKSGFIALGFFTVTYWIGGIGLLSVNPSGVDTIDASIMAFYCWLSYHFQADLYNFLIFPRHILVDSNGDHMLFQPF